MPHSTAKQTKVKRSGWSLDGRESDLDWALRVPQPNTHRHRNSTGHKSEALGKFNHVTEVFARYASMHGVSLLLSCWENKSSRVQKYFYMLMFISSLILMTASLFFLSQDSFRKESVFISSTSKETASGFDDDPFFPEYPRITICKIPSYDTADDSSEQQELLEYAYLALGYPFVALNPEHSTTLVESAFLRAAGLELPPEMQNLTDRLELRKESYEKFKESAADFNLEEYVVNNSVKCQEIFVSCIAFIFNLPCCQIFQPILTNLGYCYYLNFDKRLREIEHSAREIDFALILDFHAVVDNGKSNALGYMVFLSDPQNHENFFLIQDGYPLINGFTTKVKTRLIKTSRKALFTPWHGLWPVCPTMPEDLDVGDEEEGYTKRNCIRRYMDGAIQKKCGCSFLTGSYNNLPKCEPEAMYSCYIFSIARDNLTGMAKKCIDACFDYEYESDLTFYKIGGGDNRSRLTFMYDSLQYDLREYKKTTMSSFLSQIGGVMGLYVGASIITAMETLCYLAAYVYYRCFPHKENRSPRQSSKVSPRRPIRSKNDDF